MHAEVQPPAHAIDAVVVSWNNRDLTIDCLAHLAASSVPCRLIVVDNASADGSPAAIRERFPEALLIELDENIGYGPAMNRGAAAGDGELIALINNDANLAPDFLELTATAFSDPAVGIAGGVSINPNGGVVDAAGIMLDRGLAGYLYAVGAPPESVDPDDPRLIAPTHVAAVYRRAAFDEAGGFDEEFFAYNEEVDLVMRIRLAGWQSRIVPQARATHLGSASVGERSAKQIELASWGRGYLAGRYRVGPLWLAIELAVALIDALRLRSATPVEEKWRGWRRGRSLAPRAAPDVSRKLTLREAAGLRLAAYRRSSSA